MTEPKQITQQSPPGDAPASVREARRFLEPVELKRWLELERAIYREGIVFGALQTAGRVLLASFSKRYGVVGEYKIDPATGEILALEAKIEPPDEVLELGDEFAAADQGAPV